MVNFAIELFLFNWTFSLYFDVCVSMTIDFLQFHNTYIYSIWRRFLVLVFSNISGHPFSYKAFSISFVVLPPSLCLPKQIRQSGTPFGPAACPAAPGPLRAGPSLVCAPAVRSGLRGLGTQPRHGLLLPQVWAGRRSHFRWGLSHRIKLHATKSSHEAAF